MKAALILIAIALFFGICNWLAHKSDDYDMVCRGMDNRLRYGIAPLFAIYFIIGLFHSRSSLAKLKGKINWWRLRRRK